MQLVTPILCFPNTHQKQDRNLKIVSPKKKNIYIFYKVAAAFWGEKRTKQRRREGNSGVKRLSAM